MQQTWKKGQSKEARGNEVDIEGETKVMKKKRKRGGEIKYRRQEGNEEGRGATQGK